MKVREFLLMAAFVVVCSGAGAQADRGGVLYGCASKQSGALRMVPPPGKCKSTEVPIAWNVLGPAGPKGPAGMTGPQGPQGNQGQPGQPATIPQNITNLSNALSTTGGVAALGADKFTSYACNNLNIGDIVLSVNGYGNGAMPADGRLLPINLYQATFSLLGTTFGGNGTTNFALPDLRAFAPKGLQYSICVYGVFPSQN